MPTTPLALLMPGQGAQAVGMGKAFYDQFEEVKELYRKANHCLGFDVTALCFEGPAEDLTRTERCQPALFVTSLAAYAAFKRVVHGSVVPIGAAGLSLGELTALAAAGVFSPEDGFYLVKARAEAMAECANHHPGAMLAVVGLSTEMVEEIAKDADVWAANYNAADQLVLSGKAEGIERAQAIATEQGAKRAVRLEVSGAFHSPLMEPAAKMFAQALSRVTLAKPAFPVISNVTAQAVGDQQKIRQLLVEQITSPVRWEPSMRNLTEAGAEVFVEFPPARVLTALLRRIDNTRKAITVDEPQHFTKLSEHLGLSLTL